MSQKTNTLKHYLLILGVGGAMLTALLLPLNLLNLQPFHHDEALYATWALKIVSGQDPWLSETPLDKPPLFPYIVAGAIRIFGLNETSSRMPSLLSTALSVLLLFFLGQKLYNAGLGLLAAWLLALSPFVLLFAPTTFTDPTLMALVLAAGLAAIYKRPIWAGIFLTLAITTKQQGLFFTPLIITLLLLSLDNPIKSPKKTPPLLAPPTPHQCSYELPVYYNCKLAYLRTCKLAYLQTCKLANLQTCKLANLQTCKLANLHTCKLANLLHPTTSFTLALLLTLLPALTWDFSRNQPSSFFEQSLINYGGLTLDLAGFSQRGWGFVNLLFYSSGSYSLNLIFLIGCPLLLLYDVYCFGRLKQNGATLTPPQQQTQDPIMAQIKADCLLALFCLGFFMLHAVLSFQVWDRYMLGLMPFLALLLARVLLWPCSILKHQIDHPHPKLAFLARTGGSRVSKLHRKSNLQHLLTLIMTLALIWLLTTTLAGPIRNAINARYPLGSNSRALQGIEQITAYLQGHVGANNTLYHHWLGTHWRFYLWAYPYDLQYWESPTELAAKAKAGQYIAHPTHQSDTELRLALFETGLTLHEVTRSYSPNGVPSIILYQIELR